MTLTPRGASDVPEMNHEYHATLREFVGYWRAALGDHPQRRMFHVSGESMSPILTAIESLSVSHTALTTRSAALEAEKAELIKALREWDTVEQFDRLLDSLPPEDEPEPPNIKIDDLCNSDISRSMPEQSTGSVASSPSPAERTE